MAFSRKVVGSVLLAVFAGALGLPAPAYAHAEVEVSPAQAGAANATITFTVEAESKKAGAVSVKVVLPAGIAPADVSLVSGPGGWSLAVEADGYTVSGPALPVGRNSTHQVRLKQLPMAPTVAFKILQTYGDGQVDRWIEVPSASNPKPENPAPVVTLAAPPGGFPPPSVAASPSPVASSAPSPAGSAAPPAAEAESNDSGDNPMLWIGLGALLVTVVAGVGLIMLRRRGAAESPPPPESPRD